MANPTLPIVAGTANTVIHSASGGPAAADLGLAGGFLGCVITDLKTNFPLVQDVYRDPYMQPKVDVLHSFEFFVTFNMEVHNRDQAVVSGDPRMPKVAIGTLLSEDTVPAFLTIDDARGWATGTGTGTYTLWANGTYFIVTDGAGTFERQKLRKDSIRLDFRRYATS